MKRTVQIATLTATLLLVSVGAARADTLHYVITGPQAGVSGSFNLLQNPTVTSFTAGSDFILSVYDGSINLPGQSFSTPPFKLEFLDAQKGGGFGLVVPYLGGLQLKGDVLFTGSDSAPTLSSGIFHLDYGVTVTATAVPEPTTLLLIGFGLVGLGLFRKRLTSI
jgi:hypothetical protein